jgi:hypothetical protein
MRHILTIWLAVLLALAPLSANATTAKPRSKSSTTAAKKDTVPPKKTAAAAVTRKPSVDTRKKTENVSGYTTKKGTKVAPYKRRPAN